MSTFLSVNLCHSPASWLASALNGWTGFFAAGPPGTPVLWEPMEYEGHPGVGATFDYGEPLAVTTHIVALEDMDVLGVVPARMFVAFPGMSQTWSGNNGPDNEEAASAFAISWISFVDAVQSVIIACTNASTTEVVDIWTTYDDESKAASASAVIRVEYAETQVSYLAFGVAKAGVIIISGDDSATIVFEADKPMQSAPVAYCGGTVDSGRVAEALEVISLTDTEVAINHGAAIYSVKGKVTTG